MSTPVTSIFHGTERPEKTPEPLPTHVVKSEIRDGKRFDIVVERKGAKK